MNLPSLYPALALSLILHGGLLMLTSGKISGAAAEGPPVSTPHPPSHKRVIQLSWRHPHAPASPRPLPPEEAEPPAPLQTVLPNRRAPPEPGAEEKIAASTTGLETATSQATRSPLGPGYYFQRDEVERMPHIVADVADEKLEAQFQAHASGGRLVLELWINEQGIVDKIDVLESTQTPELAQLIISSFAKASFFPAQRHARAVKSRLKIEVVVKPKWERLELE